MGFWMYMLVMDLLIPLTMIGFGRYFLKQAPKKINRIFGYRTAMSMKNRETWEFAHQYCGKIWFTCGLIMLPVTVALLLPTVGKGEAVIGAVGGVISVVQLVFVVAAIFPTERALKKTFDQNGNRR